MLKKRIGWKVTFNYQETNTIAHNLAKVACAFSNEHIWMKVRPMQVMNVVLKNKSCTNLKFY